MFDNRSSINGLHRNRGFCISSRAILAGSQLVQAWVHICCRHICCHIHRCWHSHAEVFAFKHVDTHTHTNTHDCKTNEHNSGSECQNPRQLDRQTRQSMSNTNRRLSEKKRHSEHTHKHTHTHTHHVQQTMNS